MTINFANLLGDDNGLERILNLPKLLSNIENYESFKIWYYYFKENDEFITIILGKGIGSLSRAYEMIISPLFISSESYLVQLYYESGIVGILVFCFIYLKSIINLYKDEKTKYLSYILIAFISNILASPAFYGYSTSFLIYPIIVFGILKNKTNEIHSTYISI